MLAEPKRTQDVSVEGSEYVKTTRDPDTRLPDAIELNKLYLRAIDRRDRLYLLIDLDAPEIVVRNERRMLDSAVNELLEKLALVEAMAAIANHGFAGNVREFADWQIELRV